MLTRILTAIVLIAAVLAWLFIADYPIYAIGTLFMFAVGAYEMGPLIGFKSKLTFLAIATLVITLLFVVLEPSNFVLNIPQSAKLIVSSGLNLGGTAFPFSSLDPSRRLNLSSVKSSGL